jgi:hypothetical protein
MAKGFKPFMIENQPAHSRKLLELLLNHSLGHHLSILVHLELLSKKNNAVIDDFEIEEDADRVIFLISFR